MAKSTTQQETQRHDKFTVEVSVVKAKKGERAALMKFVAECFEYHIKNHNLKEGRYCENKFSCVIIKIRNHYTCVVYDNRVI